MGFQSFEIGNWHFTFFKTGIWDFTLFEIHYWDLISLPWNWDFEILQPNKCSGYHYFLAFLKLGFGIWPILKWGFWDSRTLNLKLMTLWCFCLYLRYGAGTQPWGNPTSTNAFEPQRHDDGYIEVIGLSTASLVSKH